MCSPLFATCWRSRQIYRQKINFPLDLHNVFFKILVWVVFIYIKAGSPLAM